MQDVGKVVGVISIGDVVKDIIRNLEHNVGDLMGYIMTDGPGGRLTNHDAIAGVRDRKQKASLTGHLQLARDCVVRLSKS